MSVVPDHIHLIMDVPPTMSVSEPFRLLGGCSSHELFKEKPKFRKTKKYLWSIGKFHRTVRDADLETTMCKKSGSNSSDLPIRVFPNGKPRTLVWGGCHNMDQGELFLACFW